MAKQKSRFPSYGLVRGPSHEGGGVAGMVAGEQPVELEGGEWIIPKEAVPAANAEWQLGYGCFNSFCYYGSWYLPT